MAQAPAPVVHQILSMADNRENVVRRELGVSDCMDYYIEIEKEQSYFHKHVYRVRQNNLLMVGTTGLEFKNSDDLDLGDDVTGVMLLNICSALGYNVRELEERMRSMQAGETARVAVFKLPRSFALKNLERLG
eukprot:TRINITY_DN17228_c0_g3_i1.p1 TRINITY_DN17228_c0_g3~~TRINITY_DN17228_c0_g3_i1.p1  ORF type:complete len:133 (+),score=19.30 TRINITY_DN17228_c0_g3_i1:37-435(+)